ncbi:hypothetical protein EGI08_00825 [Bacillus licheniformis]|nr:hypothetical protein [Bacillus licheniformis]
MIYQQVIICFFQKRVFTLSQNRLSDLEEDLELGLRSSGDVLRIKEMSYSKDNDGKDEWYKVSAGTVWVGSLKEVPQK